MSKLWEKYYTAVKKEDWQKALSILEKLGGESPDDPQVQLKAGDLLQRLGRTGEAVDSYHRASLYLSRKGFLQKALAIYKIILRIDPDDELASSKSRSISAEIKRVSTHTILSKETVGTSEAGQAIPPKSVPGAESPQPSLQERQLAGSTGPDAGYGDADTPSADGNDGMHPSRDYPQNTGPATLNSGMAPDRYRNNAEIPDDISELLKDTPQDLPSGNEGLGSEVDVEDLFSDAFELGGTFMEPDGTEGGTRSEMLPDSIFSMLSGEELDNLIKGSEPRIYERGQLIITEGSSGDSMFLIETGEVKVVANVKGRDIELARLGAGDVFGEVAFLTGRARTASVFAKTEVRALEITRPILEEAVAHKPELLDTLNKFHRERVQDTIKKIKGG